MSSCGLSRLVCLLFALMMVVLSAVACEGGGEGPSGSPGTPPGGDEAALAPCRALDSLERYRYTSYFKLESPEPSDETPPPPHATPLRPITRELAGDFVFEYKMDASFVAPDRTELVIDAGTGLELIMIAIGDEVWLKADGGWTTANTPLPPYRPDVACFAIFPELDLSTVQPEAEKINDLNTIHYSFAEVASGQAMPKMFGSGTDMHLVLHKLSVDVWLEDRDNWPVRMEIRGSGFYSDDRELRMELVTNVTDPNSKSIRVEPPY